MNALREHIDGIMYGWRVAGLGLAVVAFQIVVLVIALRRAQSDRGPVSLTLHAVAGVLIGVVMAAVNVSVRAARALMSGAYADSVDPSEKAEAWSRGLSGQMNAILFGISVTMLALLLWLVGTAVTLTAPRSDGRARSLPPVWLVGFGLLPLALGALQWCTSLIKTFAGMAGLDPELKGPILAQQLDASRAQLALFARLSLVAIAVAAVVAAVLIVVRRRRGSVADTSPRRSAHLSLAASAAALGLAALLVLKARPTAAENGLPWPSSTGSQLVWPDGPPTPDLVGPDAPSRAPVVSIFRDRVTLDAAAVNDFQELELKLGTLRNNFKLLHPGDDFNEMALIEADAATSIARLASVLRAVRGAWYYRPMFAFTRKEVHVRPVFGRLERVAATGARFRIAYTNDEPDEDEVAEWKAAVSLRLEDFADYGAFARKLVELRRAGKPVLVKVDRAQ